MDKNNSDNISIKQGFDSMLHFLKYYHDLTGSTDLTDILSGCQTLSDGQPLDTAFWKYWVDAVEKVKRGDPLYDKNI